MIVRTAAKRAVNASFELATAGWVLGPLGERNYLDTVLPEEFVAMSAIEEELGWFPPDPSFLEVKRPKWTIPWMEDDGALGEPEFWVSRTLQHAFDARTMNINGLLGIHWRTREVSLQVSAERLKNTRSASVPGSPAARPRACASGCRAGR